MDYPMRLNKYLAHQGVGTRSEADALIESGKVTVNGVRAVLGQKVLESDRVEVKRGRAAGRARVYFAYHKPIGLVTHTPLVGQRAVTDLKLPRGVFPVGRLDKDSSGLMILTNDGRVTDRLLNPDREHDKEYRVQVDVPLRPSFKKTMEAGVTIGDYTTRPCQVRVTSPTTFTITLTEGKKHQIRRMVAVLHNNVIGLTRTRVLTVKLGSLPVGQMRPIEDKELEDFLTALGLPLT